MESKYKSLMAKMEQTHQPPVSSSSFKRPLRKGENDEAQSLFQNQDGRVRGGHDEALKTLYDQSVSFKNDLSELRTRIKGLSAASGKYNARVEEFEAELKEFGRKNEQLQKEKTKLSEQYGARNVNDKQQNLRELQGEFYKIFNKH
eukprot:403334791